MNSRNKKLPVTSSNFRKLADPRKKNKQQSIPPSSSDPAANYQQAQLFPIVFRPVVVVVTNKQQVQQLSSSFPYHPPKNWPKSRKLPPEMAHRHDLTNFHSTPIAILPYHGDFYISPVMFGVVLWFLCTTRKQNIKLFPFSLGKQRESHSMVDFCFLLWPSKGKRVNWTGFSFWKLHLRFF